MSEQQTMPTRSQLPRNAVLVGGGLALAGFGLAAGLMLRSPARTEAPAAAPEAPAAVSAQAPVAQTAAPTTEEPTVAAAPAHAAKPAPHKVAPRHEPTQDTHVAAAPSGNQVPVGMDTGARAPACANCGVVESVQAVQQKGEGSGLGAVAGGVVGGALGNQMGHGNGRAAMTILGAIGGGLAGNEIEKRTRSETVYQVRVRMDDGSVRTLTQQTAPAAGARVAVEGQTLRALGNAPATGNEPRLVHTNAQGV